jgi:K(+)-stimulated pyrophosphate-energized sodium pump
VTELGLIVGIDVVGLALALLMWRGVSLRDSGSAAMRRLGGALERAARAFLWQEYRLIAVATLALLVLGVTAHLSWGSGAGPVSQLGSAFWVASGVCLGALGTTLSGYAGTVLAVRGSTRVAAASGSSVDAGLSVAMRAAGAASLFGETLSGLCVVSLFGLLFAVQGGFALASSQVLPLATHVVLLLPSFALGSAVSALVLQRGGGAFHAASGVGSDQAGERDAGLEHDDARNPAVVAELVGDHVGASATRAVDAFASACVANVAVLVIGTALASSAPSADPLALLALPLVVRAFGVIASAFGLLLVRTEETSSLRYAVMRGYLSTAAITLASLGGTAYWLFGEHFLAIFACGALGLGSLLLAAHALLLQLRRRSAAMRDGSEGLRIGGGALVSAGLGAGLESALLPSSILAVAIALSIAIGAHSGLASGIELGLLVFALAALSVAPFVLSIATLGSIADGARGIAQVSGADGELKRRSARLDDAGFSGSAVARQYAVFSGTVSSLLMAWAIAVQGRAIGGSPPSLVTSSALVWCGALGAAVVLGYAGAVARAAVRGAREVTAEVERQLRGFPRDHGVAQVPLDYTPSYKTCIELTAAVALRRALGPIAAGLAAPLVLGIGLRLSFRSLAPDLVAQGLAWFVVAASLTGLTSALAAGAARATLGSVRRANAQRREGGNAFLSALSADSVSDIFGNAAAPALQLLVKATAAAALIITPFLL